MTSEFSSSLSRSLHACSLQTQRMTNDEARMTKECRSPNAQSSVGHSDCFSHSCLVISHSDALVASSSNLLDLNSCLLWTQFSSFSSSTSGSSFRKGNSRSKARLPGWMLLALVAACGCRRISLYRKSVEHRQGLQLSPGDVCLCRCCELPSCCASSSRCFVLPCTSSTLLPRENIAALLFDDSGSMTIQDAAGQSRLDAVKQFLDPKPKSFSWRMSRRSSARGHFDFPETPRSWSRHKRCKRTAQVPAWNRRSTMS